MATEDFRSIYMPYCIQQISDGRHVVLNRKYKPLGVTSNAWVEYQNYAVKFKGLTAKKAAKLSWEGSEDLARIFLYNDGCVPTENAEKMKAYQARLAILGKLQFEIPK